MSRCSVKRSLPMDWVDWEDLTSPGQVKLSAWLETLAPFNVAFVVGQIDALRELAAEGRITHGDTGKLNPIRDEPEIYELKWKLLSVAVRQYHGEPTTFPTDLVRLHMHIKEFVPGDRKATSALQDIEIEFAVKRYVDGEPANWGM